VNELFGLDQQDHSLIQQLLRDWKARFPWLRPHNRRRGGWGGGGSKQIVWATVLRSLSYDDPPTTGISSYIVRPTTSTIESWENKGYSIGDVVSYDSGSPTAQGWNRSYTCIQAPGSSPPTEGEDNAWWTLGGSDEIEIDLSMGYAAYSSSKRDLRNWLGWLVEDGVQPIIKRAEPAGDKWFFALNLFFAGTEATSSLRWHETDKRVMAVWR